MEPLSLGALYGGSALSSALSGLTQGRGKFRQLPTMTPEQMGRANLAGQLGLNQIQNPYSGFDPIAKRAQSVFSQQTVPSLAERFTSMGGGAISSPAFASQLGEAGAGLSEALAAMQSEYGLKQQGLGQGLLGLGQAPQFQNVYEEPRRGFLSSLFGGAASGLGAFGNLGLQQRYGGDQSGEIVALLRRLLSQQGA